MILAAGETEKFIITSLMKTAIGLLWRVDEWRLWLATAAAPRNREYAKWPRATAPWMPRRTTPMRIEPRALWYYYITYPVKTRLEL